MTLCPNTPNDAISHNFDFRWTQLYRCAGNLKGRGKQEAVFQTKFKTATLIDVVDALVAISKRKAFL